MTHDAVSRLSAKLNGPITLTPRKSVAAVAQAVHTLPPSAHIEINRELTRLLPQVTVETPPLDLSKIPPGWTARIEESLEVPELEGPQILIPSGWIKGQLLNVRNNGAEFVVTTLGEEFDPRYPERALKFDNSWTCQQFISKWYARESHDPRAF